MPHRRPPPRSLTGSRRARKVVPTSPRPVSATASKTHMLIGTASRRSGVVRALANTVVLRCQMLARLGARRAVEDELRGFCAPTKGEHVFRGLRKDPALVPSPHFGGASDTAWYAWLGIFVRRARRTSGAAGGGLRKYGEGVELRRDPTFSINGFSLGSWPSRPLAAGANSRGWRGITRPIVSWLRGFDIRFSGSARMMMMGLHLSAEVRSAPSTSTPWCAIARPQIG